MFKKTFYSNIVLIFTYQSSLLILHIAFCMIFQRCFIELSSFIEVFVYIAGKKLAKRLFKKSFPAFDLTLIALGSFPPVTLEFMFSSVFSEFSSANSSLAEVISEDDVCRALCIPPIYTENFDQKHFLLNKFTYFRILFCLKTI